MTGPKSRKVFAIGELLRQMEHGRRPAVLVFENVPNLLTKKMGFEAFAEDVQNCGYRLGALVVDAVHWVPCSRERVFVIAYREGLPLPEGCVKDRPGPHWHPPSLLRAHARLDAETKAKWVWWHLPPPPSTAPMLAQILEQDGVRAEDWFGPDLLNRFGDLVGLAPTYLAKLEAAMAAYGVVWGVTVEKTDTKQPEGQYYYRGRPCKRRIAEFRAGVVFTLCATVTGTSRQNLVKVHRRKVAIREFRPREVARSIGVPDELAVPDTL